MKHFPRRIIFYKRTNAQLNDVSLNESGQKLDSFYRERASSIDTNVWILNTMSDGIVMPGKEAKFNLSVCYKLKIQ